MTMMRWKKALQQVTAFPKVCELKRSSSPSGVSSILEKPKDSVQTLEATGSQQTSSQTASNNDGQVGIHLTAVPSLFSPTWSFSGIDSYPSPARDDAKSRVHGKSFRPGDVSDSDSETLTTGPSTNLVVPLSRQRVVIEVTDDDDFINEEDFSAWTVEQDEAETRRLSTVSTDSQRAPRRRSSNIVPRNIPITAPFESLDSLTHDTVRLAPNVFVELRDGEFENDFMKIVHIVRDRSTSEVTLRGHIFRRTRFMNDMLEKKLNEVCWIIHIDDDDPRDPNVQGVETVPVTDVGKRRRIRLTNQSFPALSFRGDANNVKHDVLESESVLVCRYKYLCFYPTAKARIANGWCEKGFHRLRQDECDKWSDNNMPDGELRRIWRGATVPGGAKAAWLPGEKEFLRQEHRSHEGLTGSQSLKSPFGPDFPQGDPMKRGNVGRVLGADDLGANFNARHDDRRANALPHTAVTIDDGNADTERINSPSLSAYTQQQRRVHNDRRNLPAASTEWLSDSSDYESDDSGAIFALSRGVIPDSFDRSRQPRQKSPQVIEIDAQVKTSSSSGIYQRHYAAKITSSYKPAYKPSPLAQNKRAAGSLSPSPERRAKKVDVGTRVGSEHRDSLEHRKTSSTEHCHHTKFISSREGSHAVRETRFGHSQVVDPDAVVELGSLSKTRGYKTGHTGLLTPVSVRKRDSIRSTARSWSPISLPRSSTGSSISTQDLGQDENQDKDAIIELTKPPPKICFANVDAQDPRRSAVCQSILSASLSHRPTPSSNQTSPSPLPQKFARHVPRTGPERTGSRQRSPSSRQSFRMSTSNNSRFPLPSGAVSSSSQSPRPSSRKGGQIQVKSATASVKKHRYTVGDCFCGAGGFSRGAVNAGLRVEWGFDFNLPACLTYVLNFFGTPIYNVWANEFAAAPGDHKVDICHMSPPCQFFSDAHTIMGKDDEMNTASLFAIFNLLEKVRPRIVTLEQTSGLIRRHPIFFNAVINMFTTRGFSVRWRVMNCADFGLPQRRMRLFIIASW